MDEVTGCKIDGDRVIDSNGDEVKDVKGTPAPDEVVQVLKKTGVAGFSFCSGIDWNVIKADAETLFQELAVGPSQ